ncbi:hypothetical protein QYF61_019756 [Mycteria americana]|uniref:RNase H type-1 domain-containing protein n=1 Tax=Mycteria americana TaxID=33587 RepID=A0AAN7MPR5_MYCAM|nr:hypothetical protein QYF61_019756 [Mycteria americana]
MAFYKLKEALMLVPALGLRNLEKPFELFVNERQHVALGALVQKTGSWKRPVGYFSKQLDQVSKGWPSCLRAVAATVLPLPGETELEHDCLKTIEQVYASRTDLRDIPLDSAELNLFIDGSSQVINGIRRAGYAVIIGGEELDELEAKALPANTSAQKAELVALIRALELAEGKTVNIWTDSKYVFGIIHAHGAIWKERGLLSSQGTPVKYGELIRKILQVIKLPEQVAIMHCKAHQFGNTPEVIGKQRADLAAKRAAEEQVLGIWPEKYEDLKGPPTYNKEDDQLAKLLNAKKNKDGWWITEDN